MSPRGSRVIIALDPPPDVNGVGWASRIISETRDLAAGFKVGLPLLLSAGPGGLGLLASLMGDDVLRIADLKLADVGFVMSSVVRRLVELGYDTIIAHSFIGGEGALDELASTCRELGVKLVAVVSMSHGGSREVMDRVLGDLVSISLRAGAWGLVVPATRPRLIKLVRSIVGHGVKLLSPGVGPQGARPGDAIRAGADYEIVGRLITRSPSPRSALAQVIECQEACSPSTRTGVRV